MPTIAAAALVMQRSMLFVPGSEPARMEKALGLPADVLIYDLEDAVAIDAKTSARDSVVAALGPRGSTRVRDKHIIVRVNSIDTPYFADDVAALLSCNVDGIMLPKSEQPEQIRELCARLEGTPIALYVLIETAKGVMNAAALSTASPRIHSLCFGHADFARDMGLDNDDAGHGVILQARAQISLAARAAEVGAIDNVSLAIKDPEAFKADAALGRSLGYQGKLCIHPAQLELANAVYTPTQEQIAYAQKVCAAWDEAKAKGLGVFSLNNKMIDAPVVEAQQALLGRAKLAGVL